MDVKHTEDIFAALKPDQTDRKPLYLQLAERLRELINSGTLCGGDAVPPERELAELTGVSRVTVRKSLEQLVTARLLIQRPGAGTFVSSRIQQPLSVLMGFSDDMRARGYEPASIWLDKRAAGASPDEAMALSIAPAAPVLRLKRIRARMATLHEADLLHISPPTAILEIERRSFLPDGRTRP